MQILFFFFLLLQVLKPVTEQYMGDNMRQTVMNSIRASLTEQGSQQTRLKSDWCSSSSTLPVIFIIIILHWLGVFSPRTVKLVQHQSWPTFFVFPAKCPSSHSCPPLYLPVEDLRPSACSALHRPPVPQLRYCMLTAQSPASCQNTWQIFSSVPCCIVMHTEGWHTRAHRLMLVVNCTRIMIKL